MAISDDFNVDSSNNIRADVAFIPGTHLRYSTLELHAWLQSLADDAGYVGDDEVDILDDNPSELAGKRNASRPMALTLLNSFNIDDAASQWFKFGSVEQTTGNYLYTGLKIIGSLVANSPIYIIQNGAKLTKYWADSDTSNFQILVKAMTGGTLIDSGNISVFSRKYGQTYSHTDVNLAAGSEQPAALSTAIDSNVDTGTMTPTAAAAMFSSSIGGTGTPGSSPIELTWGSTSQDMGDGNGSKTYYATITLNGSTSLSDAYQALMWACSESSTITFNTVPGYRYRALPGQAYAENISAPFGQFAGGKFFVAQGYWLAGVQAADSKNYQLISHDGTTIIPPTSILIEVTNVTTSDYVLAARDDGAGGILDTEYTVTASAAATSITVTGLKSDTPASGVIRINGNRHTYTDWSGTTINGLSPAVPAGGYSSASAFIPFIDGVPASTTIQSAAMQFSSNFTARFRVRNGGGSPIVPFESTLSVTTSGGSGTTVRNADA